MFSSLRTRIIPRSLAIVLAALLPVAQALQLGALSLAQMPANTMSSVTFSLAPSAFRAFAGAVGGVAFTATAHSADGATISGLRYDAAAPDGGRLLADVRKSDGSRETVSVEAFDWVLVPLARLVATDATGAVTLFGSLKDADLEEKLRAEEKAMIANYHPALENTLLGLRLLQADMMPIEENATDLFKEKGQYILGAGEVAPSDADLKANLARFNRVSQWTERQPQQYSSYITGDVDSKVTFTVQAGKLKLAGEPTWYCWKWDEERIEAAYEDIGKSLSSDAFALLMLSRIDDRTNIERRQIQGTLQAKQQASTSVGPIELEARAESQAYRALGKLILARIVASPGGARGATLFDKAILETALAQSDTTNLESLFAQAADRAEGLVATNPERSERLIKELETVQPRINAVTEKIPVVQMPQYSAEFSKKIADERGINPIVYSALRRSLQISALFRSAKETDPGSYQKFVQSLQRVALDANQPRGYRVSTPTVYPRN